MSEPHPDQARQWAHLRPLSRCYQGGCDRPATQSLHNGLNARVGDYCDRHATAALKRFKEGK